jgi:hypothetical protein
MRSRKIFQNFHFSSFPDLEIFQFVFFSSISRGLCSTLKQTFSCKTHVFIFSRTRVMKLLIWLKTEKKHTPETTA